MTASPAIIVVSIALGVHVAAGFVLALLGWSSRPVRAYLVFLAALTAWMLLLLLATLPAPPLGGLRSVVTHLLPLTYAAFGASLRWPVWPRGFVPALVGGLLLLPLCAVDSPWYLWRVDATFQVVAWSAGVWFIARARPGRAAGAHAGSDEMQRARRIMRAVLLVAGTVNILLGTLTGGASIVNTVPITSSLMQLLVLYGVLRVQLYGITARYERTTALAEDAAARDRLTLLGELGATVAHEVRNPLTGIRSLAQRIADGEVDAAKRARYASLITSEVDRLDRFVGSMLRLARGAPRSQPQLVDAPALVEDLQLLVGVRAQRRRVTLDFDATSAPVHGSREALAQVLLNLLINAIDHTPEGGHVRLRAGADADGTYRVRVEDDGPGVAPEDRERIFAPFTGEGTGIGLAVVRRVCDEQGWRTMVHERDGKGAVFEVSLGPTSAATQPDTEQLSMVS